jgi:hypothetical protein
MLAAEEIMDSDSQDEVWKALRPSEAEAPNDIEQQDSESANEFRRLMLSSQEFRALPSVNPNAQPNENPNDVDKAVIDTVFACLAICADEEHRAASFGSLEGVTSMRRTMHAIKKKFGLK